MQKAKLPSIVHHRARNAGVVFLRGTDGKRRMVYLGVHGSEEPASVTTTASMHTGTRCIVRATRPA